MIHQCQKREELDFIRGLEFSSKKEGTTRPLVTFLEPCVNESSSRRYGPEPLANEKLYQLFAKIRALTRTSLAFCDLWRFGELIFNSLEHLPLTESPPSPSLLARKRYYTALEDNSCKMARLQCRILSDMSGKFAGSLANLQDHAALVYRRAEFFSEKLLLLSRWTGSTPWLQ